WKASRSASIISRSLSANLPSAQATLTSDLTMAMSCACMAGDGRGPPRPGQGRVHAAARSAEAAPAGRRRDEHVDLADALVGREREDGGAQARRVDRVLEAPVGGRLEPARARLG